MREATMLYRPGDKPNEAVWGRNVETTVVDADEVSEALEQGWYRHPDDISIGSGITALLDEKADAIAESLPALTDDELAELLKAETAGKTRKGVISALEDETKRRATA